MKTVLIPMTGTQSCGSTSVCNYGHRRTDLVPTKRQVVGLVGAALGIQRDDKQSIRAISCLRMGVRVDIGGSVVQDFCVSGAGGFPATLQYKEGKKSNIKIIPSYGIINAEGEIKLQSITIKYYLSDAYFLVALEGDDSLIQRIHSALACPKYGLFLGRKAFLPTIPCYLPNGLHNEVIEDVFSKFIWLPKLVPNSASNKWIEKKKMRAKKEGLRTVIECYADSKEDRRLRVFDVALSFTQEDRIFFHNMPRFVKLGKVKPVTETTGEKR